MSRRGGRDEYEDRAYYASEAPSRARTAPIRARDLLEIDINARARGPDRERQPAFLREDYARAEDQPLVLRKREVETFTRPVQRPRSPSIERERERIRTRVVERQRSPSPEVRERVRTRVVERERQRSPSPEIERVRTRVVERERERSPDVSYRTRVVERERERSYSPPERIRTRVVERERSREREPSVERIRTTTRTVERERQRTPSPVRETIRTRVVERTRERSSSSSSSARSAIPVEPPVIRAPPIHQEIITHHRHIDHGYDYQPIVQAPPAPAPVRQRVREAPRESKTEIDIYKGRNETEIDIHTSSKREEVRDARPARTYYDDDVLIERDRERLHVRESHSNRRRSLSMRREPIREYESEAEYYARKTAERAQIGEAYNGATKDWAIVDVPPGTERVRMDGVGGGSQEITWQRYNGVRRSKFIPEQDSLALYDREREREYVHEEVTDRRVALPLPPRNKYGDMWTEITKDLVVREAIEELGYDYEETEYFYYIIQYLKYEDVQELVFLSEDYRRARRSRIREIAYEKEHLRDHPEHRRALPEYEDERIIEREIIYDGPPRRRYR